MWTFNCARVHVGDYSYGYISFMPQDDTYHSAKCGYTLLTGEINTKRLRPLKIRGARDSEGDDKYHLLETFMLYPITDMAIINVFNHKGSYKIRLIKHQQGAQSTMYKERLE